MNINAAVAWILVAVVGLYSWRAFLHQEDPPPSSLPWAPIDVRKTKVYVSQTKDAGMFVERQRRLAILQNKPLVPSFQGSTNGYLEYGLTGLGVRSFEPICGPPEPVIWSNGDADDTICDIVDAGGAGGMYDAVDFGGAAGNVCQT
jgi:hypothetical protein